MKRLILLLSIILAFACPLTAEAKDIDIQTKLESIAKQTSKDLGLPYTPNPISLLFRGWGDNTGQSSVVAL